MFDPCVPLKDGWVYWENPTDSSEVTEGVRKGHELGYLKGQQMGKLEKVPVTPRGAS